MTPPPPALALTRIAGQVMLARCIGIAAELGLAELVAAEPRTAVELAARTGSHAGALYRMLRYLAANGLFAEDEHGRFANTPMSDVLRADAPGSLRDTLRLAWQDVMWDVYRHLPHTIATGAPAFTRAFGAPFFAYLAAHPELGARFDAAMALQSAPENATVAAAYPFDQAQVVVDVGGGRGGFMAALLQAYPRLRGILFDQAYVLDQPNRVHEAGLATRCQFVAGDFFNSVPAGGDVYVLKRILHDWPDDIAVKILRQVAAVLAPNAKVVVVDAVLSSGNAPDPNKALDVGIMALLEGRERTAEDFARLFARAGLALIRIIPTPAPSTLSLVEGGKA
jgi:hypothetical protein